MADTNRSTLLVFTLGPEREYARKRWLPARFEAAERELHRRCLDQVLEAGRAVGCRLRVCSPGGGRLAPDAINDRQAERGFGRRLLGAIRRASAEAPGRLIVVGTDSPQLDAALLRRTERALAQDPERVVIGPATDGGIYLLASTRPVVAELAAVSWRSRQTRASLVAALRAAGRPVSFLPPLRDLDRRCDLESWLASARSLVAGTAARTSEGWADLIAALRQVLRDLASVPSLLSSAEPRWVWRRVPVGRAPPN